MTTHDWEAIAAFLAARPGPVLERAAERCRLVEELELALRELGIAEADAQLDDTRRYHALVRAELERRNAP